ncbi:MAG: S24 family peptidase [Paraprevotella clara]|nr:S24 family peptidase [Paraprevotella clara]
MAGALTGENSVLEYECERYIVPAFNGADFLISVKGNSMTPTYISGDIVACQRVSMTSLFFQWNKPYVLDTAQGALIKRIKQGHDKQHILIVSDNEQYDPFELPCSEIYAVALVIGIIRLE